MIYPGAHGAIIYTDEDADKIFIDENLIAPKDMKSNSELGSEGYWHVENKYPFIKTIVKTTRKGNSHSLGLWAFRTVK